MISIINQALEAVIGLMNATHPFATVTRGALPLGNGITCELGPSATEEVYLDKKNYIPLDVKINAKHTNLKTLSDDLNTIHDTLTRMTSYPSGTGWEIVDISNQTTPQLIERETSNAWVMASALQVKLYY